MVPLKEIMSGIRVLEEVVTRFPPSMQFNSSCSKSFLVDSFCWHSFLVSLKIPYFYATNKIQRLQNENDCLWCAAATEL